MPTVTSTVVDTLRAGRERRAAENAASEAAASAQAAAAALAALQPVVTPAPVVVPAADAAASGEAKAKPVTITFKAESCDAEDGIIEGIAAVAGNIDLDNEVLEKGALIKMAFDFCSSAEKTFKANHTDPLDCKLVESWVGTPILKSGKALKKGESAPENDPIVAIGIEKGMPRDFWFVGIQPADKNIVETAKAGGIAGFSWSGYCKKTPVDD